MKTIAKQKNEANKLSNDLAKLLNAQRVKAAGQCVDSDTLDKLSAARAKLRFMTSAIVALWGDQDSLHGERTILGCQVVMHEIEDDFTAIHEALDPEAPSAEGELS